MALHTWGRNLSLNPHMHVVISHGGISKDNEWVEVKKKRLFPYKPVMMMFKGKVIDMIKRGVFNDEIVLPDGLDQQGYLNLIKSVRNKFWVVHFCERYNHGRGVAKYLGRYVKRSPFKNSQLISVKNNRVSFAYQSHQTSKREVCNLSIQDFIRRLMEHVSLPRKRMVRYSGIYTYSLRYKLVIAKQYFGQSVNGLSARLGWEVFMSAHGAMPTCSVCGCKLLHLGDVLAQR
jgi:hypothetical protein